MKIDDAIQAYIDQFDEGPPILGLSDDDAVRAIQKALDEGQLMERPDMENITEDSFI